MMHGNKGKTLSEGRYIRAEADSLTRSRKRWLISVVRWALDRYRGVMEHTEQEGGVCTKVEGTACACFNYPEIK